eukprot:scaffold192091_cov18-Prasinocladus_malaysianus.AAC.1
MAHLTDGRNEGRNKGRKVSGWTDGLTDGQTDRRTGWMGGWGGRWVNGGCMRALINQSTGKNTEFTSGYNLHSLDWISSTEG